MSAPSGPLFCFEPDRARELAARHGTPCFVYDARRAGAAVRRLREALPARVDLAYAVKANPHPALLAHLATLGVRFDCASAGELRRAAAALAEPGTPAAAATAAEPGGSAGAGAAADLARDDSAGAQGAAARGAVTRAAAAVPAGRLLYAGPGKREPELALALQLGARVQAEGWEDLARLDALRAAAQAAPGARGGTAPLAVNLRVHPLQAAAETGTILGGSGPSAFGVDEEDLPALLARARTLRHVRLAGLHVFAASNLRDSGALLAGHAHVFELAHTLHREHGLLLEQIDLGGGLGVPYAPDETPLDVAALGRGLAALLARHDWFTGEVLLEPGRYVAAACGEYLVRVVRSKSSRGARFAILEGGINHLLRPLLTGQPFPVRHLGGAAAGAPAAEAPALRPTVLAGPLCTALDRLGEVLLPELHPGDLLSFGMAGAYGATEAMGDFLSHPRPPEIWVESPQGA